MLQSWWETAGGNFSTLSCSTDEFSKSFVSCCEILRARVKFWRNSAGKTLNFRCFLKKSINAIIEHTKTSYKVRRVSIHVFGILWFKSSFHLLFIFFKNLHWKIPNLHNPKTYLFFFHHKRISHNFLVLLTINKLK